MNRKKEIIVIGGLILFALIIRFFVHATNPVSPDSVLYLKLAEAISNGRLILDLPVSVLNVIQPGYSLIVFIINIFFNDFFQSAVVVSVLASLTSVILIYLLGKKMFNWKIGLTTAIIIAFQPLLLQFSTTVLTESLFTAVLLGVVLMTWSTLTDNKKNYWWLMVGLLIGFSYLVRIVGLSLLPYVIIIIIIYNLFIKKKRYKNLIYASTLVIIGFLIIAGPYFFFLANQFDNFALTGQQGLSVYRQQINIVNNNGEQNNDQSLNIYGLISDKTDYNVNHWDYDANNDKSLLDLYFNSFVNNIFYNINYVISNFLIPIILVSLGIIICVKDKKNRWPVIYIILLIPIYLFLYCKGRPMIRYYLPLLPIIYLLVTWSAKQLMSRITIPFSKFSKNIHFIIILVIILLLDFAIMPVVSVTPIYKMGNHKEVSQQVIDEFGLDRKMMTTILSIAYFAKAQYYPVPYADISDIKYFADYHDIDILFLSDSDDFYTDLRDRLDISEEFRLNYGIEIVIKGNNYTVYSIE